MPGANIAAMNRTLAVLAALALIGGCGGRQMLDPPDDGGGAGTSGAAVGGASGAAGVPSEPVVMGPIDLTQAPTTFSMKCGNGAGVMTFVNPCLVGYSLNGGSASGITDHEVECALATPAGSVGWSFLVLLPPTPNPQTFFPITPTAAGVDLGNGEPAQISMVTGALTFSRVDLTNRAFIARFTGDVTWTESSGATVLCTLDTPVWGAPGQFE
jgi:hypothetical protein